jgi:adenylylsulfate kinase
MMKTPNRNRKRTLRPAVLWFTGLSGSGKSTIGAKVEKELIRRGQEVEQLDGDRLRSIFPQTGFTKEARNEHIQRVGYMASVLEKHGVFVIATFVSPYREARQFVRGLCRNFIEVHVSTPLKICEKRDVKGLYAKARRGEVKNFTGISDPYEPPRKPELRIDTRKVSVNEACRMVMEYLAKRTFR